jgi:uncharacterized membrane protein YkvA (DUF1232 family)
MGLHRLRRWARDLRDLTLALSVAARDPRVPLPAKLLAAFVLAYALSPIDLIPDVVPVLGYLDDLILLPAGIWLAVRLIPPDVWQECRRRARQEPPALAPSRSAAGVIGALWLLVILGCSFWLAARL